MTSFASGAAPARRRLLFAALGLSLLLGAAACTTAGVTTTESADGGTVASSTGAANGVAASLSPGAEPSPEAEPSSGVEPSSEYAGGTAAPSTELPTAASPGSPVSTAGPAPAPGDISQTVPEVAVSTAEAGALDATGDFGDGITARLAGVEAIDAEAQLPGEIAGPAVALTVEISNESAAAIGLDSVTIDITDGKGNPTIAMSAPPAAPFSGALAPGQTATGVYVIAVPTDARTDMAVTVSYSTGAPVLRFTGSL